eukprot:7139131-Prymnesium_polylepis.1
MSCVTRCARQTRMIASPWPVQLTAPASLSAYTPPPTMGESPTRPGSLHEMPPVEVAAARLPSASNATAPTVSTPLPRKKVFTELGKRCICCHSSRAAGVTSSSGERMGTPLDRANSVAPLPTIMTCGVRSITMRATLTGWSTGPMAATAPAFMSLPSMMLASSSTSPGNKLRGWAPRGARAVRAPCVRVCVCVCACARMCACARRTCAREHSALAGIERLLLLEDSHRSLSRLQGTAALVQDRPAHPRGPTDAVEASLREVLRDRPRAAVHDDAEPSGAPQHWRPLVDHAPTNGAGPR